MGAEKGRWGLLLEGGAARGAYEVGVYRQLWLSGRRYQVVVGVSVGAINGASFIQNPKGLLARKIWSNFNYSKILGSGFNLPENQRFIALPLLRRLVSDRGISLDPLRGFLSSLVDEQAIRDSAIDYGLTALVAGELRSLRLFKDQIAKGELLNYILASASLPVFKVRPVQNRYLLDGGLGDALPLSMLIERGCGHVDVVRTAAIKPLWGKPSVDVEVFIPSVPLPSCYDFRPASIRVSMLQGELDTLRLLRGWKGRSYYIHGFERAEEVFFRIPEEVKRQALALFGLPGVSIAREFFGSLLPYMFRLMGLGATKGYDDLLVSVLEVTAQHCGLERLRPYSLPSLMDELADSPPARPSPLSRQAGLLLPGRARRAYVVYFGWCCCRRSVSK